MAELGEIKMGREIGKAASSRFVYKACIKCGLQRWTIIRKNGYSAEYCVSCIPRIKPRFTPEEQNRKRSLYGKRKHLALKKEVFSHYSKGSMECSFCGINDLDVLCIDHINGGGKKHIEHLRKRGTTFYKWLKKNKWPDGYQVLCANCNLKKSILHERSHKYLEVN